MELGGYRGRQPVSFWWRGGHPRNRAGCHGESVGVPKGKGVRGEWHEREDVASASGSQTEELSTETSSRAILVPTRHYAFLVLRSTARSMYTTITPSLLTLVKKASLFRPIETVVLHNLFNVRRQDSLRKWHTRHYRELRADRVMG
jgi:hypothetical protein